MVNRSEQIDNELKAQGFAFMLRPNQARDALGITKHTLNRIRNDGQIRASVVNREHRYYRSSVASYLASGEV